MIKVFLGLLLAAGCIVNAAEQSNGVQVKQVLSVAPLLSDAELKKEASGVKEIDSPLTYAEIEAIAEIDQKLADALMQKGSQSATIGGWKKAVESVNAEKFMEILAYLRVKSGDAGYKRLAQIDKEVAHRIYTLPLLYDMYHWFGVKKGDKEIFAAGRVHYCRPEQQQLGRKCTITIEKTSNSKCLKTRDGITFEKGEGLAELLNDQR